MILMSVLVVDVLWQVISRYLLSSPSSFTDELAGFLLIWVGVLGAAYVAGRKEHLAIDILVQRSPPARQRRLHILIHYPDLPVCPFGHGDRRGHPDVYPFCAAG